MEPTIYVHGVGYIHYNIRNPYNYSAWVTAYTQEHADRLASTLNWQTFDNGNLNVFCNVEYSSSAQRLIMVTGWNI